MSVRVKTRQQQLEKKLKISPKTKLYIGKFKICQVVGLHDEKIKVATTTYRSTRDVPNLPCSILNPYIFY